MIKRYQVFVSSTFADLKEERAAVIQTIMELDCIPAGMEIFPAIDEEQFNFIKRVIDDCDYYILIIGGRYGTLSDDGISYTEMEYEYAIGKGIKVIAFIHSNPEEIAFSKSEIDINSRKKLEEFKKKVSTNRLIKHWRSADELPGLVALNLSKTIKTYPAVGWVRANQATNSEVLQELNEQRKLNEKLNKNVKLLSAEVNKQADLQGLADLEDEFTVQGTHANGLNKIWQTNLKWKDIFGLISPYLLESPHEDKIKMKITADLHNIYKSLKHDNHAYAAQIDNQNFQTIKIQLEALNLIQLAFKKTVKGGMALFWELTPSGRKKMTELRAIRKDLY